MTRSTLSLATLNPRFLDAIDYPSWENQGSSHLRSAKLVFFAESYIESSPGDRIPLEILMNNLTFFMGGESTEKFNSFAISLKSILQSKGINCESVKEKGIRYFTNIKLKNK